MEKQEFEFNGLRVNGFLMLLFEFVLLAGAIFMITINDTSVFSFTDLLAIACFLLMIINTIGFIALEPNEVAAMVFFGKYKGTFKKTGFSWVNPFMSKKRVSLRARNLNVDPIKVNDKIGNPVLIGLVLVWKLKDTYRAMFEIDAQTLAASAAVKNEAGKVANRMRAFENFVKVQSDAALRQVAGQYAYDNNSSNDELTLRSGGDEINEQLEQKLNERLSMAGIEVVEARLNYLAYAPEIAAVMLRRQQAAAIIAAREKIVEGAVSMVKMALEKLDSEKIVKLDDDRKAAMVGNLLVVLCADESAQPVLNTAAKE